MTIFMLNELLFSTLDFIVIRAHNVSSYLTSFFPSFINAVDVTGPLNNSTGLTDPQQIKQQLLARLVDIQMPKAIGLWPFAPGIWALIGLLIVTIISLILFRHYKKQNRYRAVALKITHDLRVNYNHSDKSVKSLQSYIQDVLTLLKQVTFTAFPKQRAEVAGYPSNNFIQLLMNNLPNDSKHFSIDKIQIPEQLLYGKPEKIDFSVAMFERFAQTWITQHNKRSPINLTNSVQTDSVNVSSVKTKPMQKNVTASNTPQTNQPEHSQDSKSKSAEANHVSI